MEESGFLGKYGESCILFRGVNKLTLDAKGRFAIPTRYRVELQEYCNAELVITIDTQRCLLIYPKPIWLEKEHKLMQMPNIDERTRIMQRLLVGHATEVPMDTQGRVLLPPPLREFANLEKQAIMIGQEMKLELWDEAHWNQKCEEWLKKFEQSEESLSAGMESLSI